MYIAPELFFCQECDPFKADIWAIGILFDELINGSPFYSSEKENTDLFNNEIIAKLGTLRYNFR